MLEACQDSLPEEPAESALKLEPRARVHSKLELAGWSASQSPGVPVCEMDMVLPALSTCRSCWEDFISGPHGITGTGSSLLSEERIEHKNHGFQDGGHQEAKCCDLREMGDK